jgi:DNA polymerase phi
MDVDEDEQASDAEHDSSLEGSADEVQEESEEDDDEEEDKELRLKLEQALGKQTSDDDSEEELMDDEQMMAIDEQLAMIFKSRTKDPKSTLDLLPRMHVAEPPLQLLPMPKGRQRISRTVCST